MWINIDDELNFIQASTYLWLLRKANYKSFDKIFGTKVIEIKAGQMITSVDEICKNTGQTKRQTRGTLMSLQRANKISVYATTKFSVITILEWDFMYIENEAKGKQRANKGQTKGKQKGNNNIISTKIIDIDNKEELEMISNSKKEDNDTDYNFYIDNWNDVMLREDEDPVIATKKRKPKIKTRIKDDPNFPINFKKCIEISQESDFLMGNNKDGWHVSFDWLIENDTNYRKVLEGRYRNKTKKIKKTNYQKLQEMTGIYDDDEDLNTIEVEGEFQYG